MLRNLAIAAVLAASGCSIFMRSVEKPSVDVRDVAMTEVSLAGVEGQVRLDVTNPNAVGVPLSGIDWQLSIAGAPAVTPVTASLRIDAADAVAVAQRVAGGARDYQLDARLHFSTALGEISVDVHKDGALAERLAAE
jgi:hypothetical protein